MQFQKGDIICKHGTSILSLGIEVVSHSPISHLALVADPDMLLLIEAEGFRDVGYKPLQDYKGMCLALRVPNLSGAQQQGIVNYAFRQLDKPYDYTEILHQAERYVLGIPDNHAEVGRFICSTLVAAAYKSVGITLSDVPLASPDDIYTSPKTIIVGRY